MELRRPRAAELHPQGDSTISESSGRQATTQYERATAARIPSLHSSVSRSRARPRAKAPPIASKAVNALRAPRARAPAGLDCDLSPMREPARREARGRAEPA